MAVPLLPLLAESAELEAKLDGENLLIVDLGRPETYAEMHVPGAVYLDYAHLISSRPPAMGLLPNVTQLTGLFRSIGLTPESHVVAYDDEGGGRAARLLWTLDVIGHSRYSLLNGGIHAWINEKRPVTWEPVVRSHSDYMVNLSGKAIADKAYILAHLNDANVILLDTRSPGEYAGTIVRAERGGHIPGAVNFDWVNAMDKDRNLRLKPFEDLRRMLSDLGVVPEKEVITYCQTHHRSAHTYFVLKYLGYKNIKGYPGSWSEWGNSRDTPVQ